VHFKHQYITNPAISPESHVVAAAQQLATALKGIIPAGNKTGEALTQVSKLFTQIATTKNEQAKAKEQPNKQRVNPTARKFTHPRVEVATPRVEVEAARPKMEVAALWVTATHTNKKGYAWTTSHGPNYTAQDKEDQPNSQRCQTRSISGNYI
jgi:hypothetical protein